MGYRCMRGIETFFKLCVYDCGRLLRVDDFTLEKVRFDYVRVLISTSSLVIVNTGIKLWWMEKFSTLKLLRNGGSQ